MYTKIVSPISIVTLPEINNKWHKNMFFINAIDPAKRDYER